MLFRNQPELETDRAKLRPPRCIYLFLLLDASNYTREGRGAKMVGARGLKSQCDIGKFDVATARDFYHQR